MGTYHTEGGNDPEHAARADAGVALGHLHHAETEGAVVVWVGGWVGEDMSDKRHKNKTE